MKKVLILTAVTAAFFVLMAGGVAAEPSAETVNRAWRNSNAYSKFKMGTLSKSENESMQDYKKSFKEKEERAKRRWIKRCENGKGEDCWKEPAAKKSAKKTDLSKRKQPQPIQKKESYKSSKSSKSSIPAYTGPIRKEKKNGVWKYSN